MVNGPSPGPEPAAQARDSSSGLTRSSWRTWPHRKLRRKVPRVDRALTAQPMASVVPPVRNTSASSMQSLPASADATSVIILSPVLALPVAWPRSRCRSTSWGRPRCRARVYGRISPAFVDQAVVVEGDVDAVGVLKWQHLLGAPCFWLVFLFQNHYPSSSASLADRIFALCPA